MKKVVSKKLSLSQITVRNLSALQLEEVAGGSLVSFKPVTCSKVDHVGARISTC